ncbi:MAG: heparan N-sulfatase, partial [Pirellulales bacterium]
AMSAAAKTDAAIAARIELFRYRVPEELYDLRQDPDCLHNLIDDTDQQSTVASLQAQLVSHMTRTNDPMLKAFHKRKNRTIVDQVLLETYGPMKGSQKDRKKKDKTRKSQ